MTFKVSAQRYQNNRQLEKQHGHYMCYDNLHMQNLGFVLLVPLPDCAGMLHQPLLMPSQIFIIIHTANVTAGAGASHPRLSKSGHIKILSKSHKTGLR